MFAGKYNRTGSSKVNRSAKSAVMQPDAMTSESEHGQESEMPDTCKICREDRELVVVSTRATNHRLFRKKGEILRLCPVCDGGALAKVLRKHGLDVDVY
jgi:hypothetical protein